MPTVAELQIDVDAKIDGAEAKLAEVNALIDALDGRNSDIGVDTHDIAAANADLDALLAHLIALSTEDANLNVDDDEVARATLEVEKLGAAVKEVDKDKIKIETEADTALVEAKFLALRKSVAELNASTANIDVDLNDAGAVANLLDLQALVHVLGAETAEVKIGEKGAAKTIATLTSLAAVLNRVDGMTARVHVRSGAETALAQARLLALQKTVADLEGSTAHIDVDVTDAKAVADLRLLQGLVAELSGMTANIRVDQDGADATIAQMVALAAVIKRIDGQTVRVHVKATGFSEVNRELKRLGSAMVNAGRSMDRTVRLVAGLATLIAPAVEVATAGFLALAGTVATAGVGVVGFGAVAATVFAPVIKGLHQIRLAQDAVNNAITDKQKEAALARLKKAYENLDPAIRPMVKSIQDFTAAWKTFSNSFRPQIFDLATRFLAKFTQLLPSLRPIIASVATAMDDLGKRMGKALDSARWKGFFDMFARMAGPSFDAVVTSIGNVIEGILGLISAFEPLTRDFNKGMVDMTRRFADWANGLKGDKSFQEWVARVRAMVPVVLHAIHAIWDAFKALVDALSRIGAVVLPVITKILNAFASFEKAHPHLTAMIVGAGALLFALIQLAGGAGLVVSAGRLLYGVFGAIAAAMGVSLGTIGLVVLALALLAAGFIIAYNNSETFRNAVDRAGQALSDFAARAGTAIMSGLGAVASWLTATFGPAVSSAVQFVIDEWNKMVLWADSNRTVLTNAWHAIGTAIQTELTFIRGLFSAFGDGIKNLWSGIWPGMIQSTQGAWEAIKGIIRGVLEVIRGYITGFAGLITGDWRSMWNGLVMVLSGWGGMIVGILRGAFDLMTGVFRSELGAIHTLWKAVWNLLPDDVRQALAPVGLFVQAMFNTIEGILDGNLSMIKQGWTNFWNSLPHIVQAGLQAVGGIIWAAVNLWIAPFQWLYNFLVGHSLIPDLIAAIVAAFASLGGLVAGALAGLASTVATAFVGVVAAVTAAMVNVALAVTNGMVAVGLAFTTGFAGLALTVTTAFAGVVAAVAAGMVLVALAVTNGFIGVVLAVTTGMIAFALAVTNGFVAVIFAVIAGMLLFVDAVTAGMVLVVAAVAAGWALAVAATVTGVAAMVAAAAAGMAAEIAVVRTGMAGIVVVIRAGWAAANAATRAGMATQTAAIRAGGAAATASTRTTMSTILSATRAGMSGVVAAVRAGMNAFVAAVRSGGSAAVAAVRMAVVGMQSAARSGAGGMRSAGASLMAAFAAGVRSRANDAVSAARAAVNKIAGMLPGSPADYGPLSGQGYVKIRGQHFSEDLAAGIAAEEAAIRRATQSLAGVMAFPMPAPNVGRTTTSPVSSSRDVIDLDRLATVITRAIPKPGPPITVNTYNPLPESTAVTVNRTLQKASVMGWID